MRLEHGPVAAKYVSFLICVLEALEEDIEFERRFKRVMVWIEQ